jgi:hypothetical protein
LGFPLGDSTLTVSIASSYAEAWEVPLDARAGVTCGPVSGQTLRCSVSAERASVTGVAVDVVYR